MNQIEVSIIDNKLRICKIRKRQVERDIQEVDIAEMKLNKVYGSYVKITSENDRNKIFYFEQYQEEEIEPDDVDEELNLEEVADTDDDVLEEEEKACYLIVYSDGEKIKFSKGAPEVLLKKLVPLKIRILSLKMNKAKIKINFVGYFINKYQNVELTNQCVSIGEELREACSLPIQEKTISPAKLLLQGGIKKVTFLLKDILNNTDVISSPIFTDVDINGITVSYGMPKKKKKLKVSRRYFAPVAKVVRDDFMLFVRRNARGNVVLVTRFLDEYEKTWRYRFWESKFVSFVLYYLGKVARKLSRKKTNIYFEKETMKAEEGAYDVFKLAQKENTSKNYFIIDEHSGDYERIGHEKNVIRKYSAKYYWIVYCATNAITTEAPAHFNILRSANKYIRLRAVEMKFVFLQHGVTYMKCHGKTSAFVRGGEAQPDYIFVDSEKERDVVVDMLQMKEENVLITGLPIFSTIDYKHIDENSEDYVTIMLTFKPYEERLDDFENSRYYHAVLDLYAILKEYIPEEKILIVAHPRIHYLLETTSLKERMWDKPISEVLKITKLMITDYSSVSYNSFYQGSAVMFYQEDIEEYQEICGELIPTDEEYIGRRAFSLEEFREEISHMIVDGKINMDYARTAEHEKNYLEINEFHDGKNVERICEKLKELQLI